MSCQETCDNIEIVQKIGENWTSSMFSPESFHLETFNSNSVVFIFAQADRVRECDACRTHFEHAFQMPQLWWFSWCRRANGYFGSEEKVADDGKIDAHNTWFRFIIKRFLPDGIKEDNKDYVWYKFNVFTHWNAKTKATYIIVFDARDEVKKLIVGSLGGADENKATEPLGTSNEPPTEKNASTIAESNIKEIDSNHSHEKRTKAQSKPESETSEKPKPKKKGSTPTRLLDRITDRILINPYAVHVLFMEDVAYQQDESVWGIRNRLRDFEKRRTANPNYEAVHDIARHAIHVSETLDAAICTIASIKAEHDCFQKAQEPENKKMLKADVRRKNENEGTRVRRGLDFSDSMLRNLRYRSESNMTRLQNEIQLAYNTVSQNIGHATKADSNAMLGFTILTMFFLPPTFMSSIFSMSFFDYDSEKDHWAVSGKFWLWVATTIPLTLISFLVLGPRYLWKGSAPTRSIQEAEKKKSLEQLFQKWKSRHGSSNRSPV